WQMSIGASIEKVVFLEEGETASVNGRRVSGPAYIVRQSTLNEVSFVALGADDNTSAKVAANAADSFCEVLTMKFDDWLKANGWGEGVEVSASQLTKLQKIYEMETAAPEEDPPAGEKPKPGVQAKTKLEDFVSAKKKD